MNAVIYGAGNIGRGFIGPLFAKAGYKVTFIDVADKIVDALKERGSYPVRLLSNDGFGEITVEGVSAINGKNGQEVIDCIAGADIMATAVGVRILPLVAPLIAGGLKKRFRVNAAPLNIIVCENLIDADKYLADLIRKDLDAGEAELLRERTGFVEASIGRMVPIQTPEMQDGDILRICSEKYAFLPVNKDAFVGEIPKMEGLAAFGNFDFFIQRKLFIHNMGHGVCAYLGQLLGDTYIYESAARTDVVAIAQNAMLESALALHRKFGMPLTDMAWHIRDLLCRFNNRALGDTCARVGADIERKLGPSDRFIGAIKRCMEQGVTPAFISVGAAAALHCLVKERGPDGAEGEALLEKISGLERQSAAAHLILGMYDKIRQGRTPGELFNTALFLGNKEVI